MVTLLSGLVGGLVATIAMTMFMMALGFAAVLTVVGMVFWMRVVLAMEPEPKTAATFGFFHAVYGVVLAGSLIYLAF